MFIPCSSVALQWPTLFSQSLCFYHILCEVVVNTADIISQTRKKRFRWRSCKLIEVDLKFSLIKDCLVEFARFEAKD